MEQDTLLKAILLNSAEPPSAGFTDAVMKKVIARSVVPIYDQPLVNPKLKRLFMVTFGTLAATIIFLCLIILFLDPQVIGRLQNMNFPDLNYSRVLTFILIFWIVFIINILIQKKAYSWKSSFTTS